VCGAEFTVAMDLCPVCGRHFGRQRVSDRREPVVRLVLGGIILFGLIVFRLLQ
jgi:hypothetical protein